MKISSPLKRYMIYVLRFRNAMKAILIVFFTSITMTPSWAAGLSEIYCADQNGREAQILADSSEKENAYAAMTESGPIIGYDPVWISSLPSHIGAFILLHECGHHTLGHPVTRNPSLQRQRRAESEADCWAARRWLDIYFTFDNWYSGQRLWDKMDQVVNSVHQQPGGWVHKRGSFRADDLVRCFNE